MSDDVDAQPQAARKRATSADVARASGVSRATVSYVLNDAPGRNISEKTRELVLKTAKELGHLPFAPARTLRLGRSDIVLALVRDFGLGYVSNEILHDLDVALAQRGYLVLVHRFDASLRSVSELWGAVSPALVVAMGGMSVPDQSMIEDTNTRLLRVHGNVRHSEAGEMQIDHLHSRGHRTIGYAFSVAESVRLVADERFAGAERASVSFGLPSLHKADVDINDPSTIETALDGWLAGPDPVTAICAHNDEVALMIIASLAERGLRAGEDIAVIGIDNIPAARVSLTTVQVDADAWGKAVIESVLALLEGKEPPPVSGRFLKLIVRSSA